MARNIELPNDYLSRDMVESMALKDDPSYIRWTNEVGHAAIESVEFSIGGRSVQKTNYVNGVLVDSYPPYGDHDEEKQYTSAGHFGCHASMCVRRNPETGSAITDRPFFSSSMKGFEPFNAFPVTRTNVALPLVALQYHDVQVTVRDREDDLLKKRQLTDDELDTPEHPDRKHQKLVEDHPIFEYSTALEYFEAVPWTREDDKWVRYHLGQCIQDVSDRHIALMKDLDDSLKHLSDLEILSVLTRREFTPDGWSG